MTLWNQDEYIRAWGFAAEAHAGQTVTGTEMSYLWHIGLVSTEAMAVTTQEAVKAPDLLILCAVLHDVIEDTPRTFEDISTTFGPEVADGVSALTKNEILLTKDEQMADSLKRIRRQPKEIRMVKLCDRIANLQPPPAHWDASRIKRYREESRLILDTLGEASPYLSARLAEKIRIYSNQYAED